MRNGNLLTPIRERHHHYTNGKKSPTYQTWAKMHDRCLNPKENNYSRYGGRGVKIDPNWRSFTNFIRDMGLRPDGMTLDRIDPEKGYEKMNCRWATPKEQAQNKRKKVKNERRKTT